MQVSLGEISVLFLGGEQCSGLKTGQIVVLAYPSQQSMATK